MTASRKLGPIERAMAICAAKWPLNLVTVLELDAVPDTGLLRTVLDELQARYPSLRARIDGKMIHYDVTDPVSLIVVERRSDGSWIDAVERGLNEPLSKPGPLVAVTLVKDAKRSELVIAHHHGVVDGTSAAELLGALLTSYAAALRGDPPVTTPNPEPAPIDELFPRKHRGLRLVLPKLRFLAKTIRAEFRHRRSIRGHAPKVDRRAVTRVHTVVFDPDTTARIGLKARRESCTLHGLIQAVVLQEVHRSRYESAPLRLRTIAFADLRPHLDPSPTPDVMAPYLTLVSQDVDAGPDTELWELARDLQIEIRDSLAGSAKFASCALSAQAMRMATAIPRMRMATTAVSHTGPVPIAGSDGPLPVTALHAFVSNLPIGPELSMRTGLFRGGLTLDMMSLDTDMSRAELDAAAARIATTLYEIAAS